MNNGRMTLAVLAVVLAFGLPACHRHGKAQQAQTEQAVQPADQAPEPPIVASTAPADLALAGKVNAAFSADPVLRVLEINVSAAGGAVTLSGSVNTQESKARAGEVAAAVAGVTSVDNRLRVPAPQ